MQRNQNEQPEKPKSTLAYIKSMLGGKEGVSSALGGATGGYVCFPFEGLKKRIQTKQPISFNPKELFRGSTAFSGSVMLATFSQMGFYDLFKQIPGYNPESKIWNTNLAIASGMLGAVVASAPVENVILTQQLNKTNPINAIKIMFKDSLLRPWTGVAPLMYREAGFGLTMLYGAEEAYRIAHNMTGSVSLGIMAQIAAGMGGAIITQPGDTIATRMQKHGDTLSQAVSNVKKEGFKGFFKGGSQRLFLFTGCATIIPPATRAFKRMLGCEDESKETSKVNLKH
ncbi:MAG TPA: MC/SLC25 family protein [Gammaproteobacteria bacterium]|nr:MC/SLC25 family protein [Gammaproteobacteria bacterium]